MTMGAIPNQGMNVSICDARVGALSIRTGEALCIHPFRCSAPAFDLTPGAHRERRRLHTRREGGGEATDGAIVWGARRCRRQWSGVRLTAADWAEP